MVRTGDRTDKARKVRKGKSVSMEWKVKWILMAEGRMELARSAPVLMEVVQTALAWMERFRCSSWRKLVTIELSQLERERRPALNVLAQLWHKQLWQRWEEWAEEDQKSKNWPKVGSTSNLLSSFWLCFSLNWFDCAEEWSECDATCLKFVSFILQSDQINRIHCVYRLLPFNKSRFVPLTNYCTLLMSLRHQLQL